MISVVVKLILGSDFFFTRFWNHVVRDEMVFQRITHYISINNDA